MDGLNLSDFLLLGALPDLRQRFLVQVLRVHLAFRPDTRSQTEREVATSGAYVGNSATGPNAEIFHDLHRPLPSVALGARGECVRRNDFG